MCFCQRGRRGLWADSYVQRVAPKDTLKLYTKAHGTKTSNLIINMEDKDERFLFRDDTATLASYGCGVWALARHPRCHVLTDAWW